MRIRLQTVDPLSERLDGSDDTDGKSSSGRDLEVSDQGPEGTAVRGTILRRMCAPPFAATAFRPLGTTGSVFALLNQSDNLGLIG